MVYAKGREIATFVLDPLPPAPNRVRFVCQKLDTVWFKAMITAYPHPQELTVR